MSFDSEESILDKLDKLAPASLQEFDAFPKLPPTYKSRSDSRGALTLVIAFISVLLILNDVGEYIWGWPDYEFNIDREVGSSMNINVDMMVNMPCQYLSVDLRDAVGDRLFLSSAFRRDGTLFDTNQAHALHTQSTALTAQQAVAQSRNSRGFFATLMRKSTEFRPTYNHIPDGSACRIYGSLQVKKVTANLHITTLGHGYASYEHVDHNMMNLSHVITEFSFGPYFPDITQPLDYSYEIAQEPFTAFQYFLTVVPTTYIAPRKSPLRTHQYSVTHYTRVLEHNQGTPGIFFKFDIDPLAIAIHQRTTTFVQLLIRCVGVVGGIWVCMGWAIKVGYKAAEAVTGHKEGDQEIVAVEASGAKRRWTSGDLRPRGKVVPQGNGWVVEGGSPYGSQAGTPSYASNGFGSHSGSPLPGSPYFPASPLVSTTYSPGHSPHSPSSPSLSHSGYPISPRPDLNGYSNEPAPVPGSNDASYGVPPPRSNGLRKYSHSSRGSVDSYDRDLKEK